MHKNGLSYEDAHSYLSTKRSIIRPNEGFEKQLMFLGSKFFETMRSATTVELFEFWTHYIFNQVDPNQNSLKFFKESEVARMEAATAKEALQTLTNQVESFMSASHLQD